MTKLKKRNKVFTVLVLLFFIVSIPLSLLNNYRFIYYLQTTFNIGREVSFGNALIYPPDKWFLFYSERKDNYRGEMYDVIPMPKTKDLENEIFIFKNIKSKKNSESIFFTFLNETQVTRENKVISKLGNGKHHKGSFLIEVGCILGYKAMIMNRPKSVSKGVDISIPSLKLLISSDNMENILNFTLKNKVTDSDNKMEKCT